MSWNDEPFEGKKLSPSSYDPSKPYKPTIYRARRAMNPLMRALGVGVREDNMATLVSHAGPGAVVIEVGAYDGANTLFWANM